jgi:dephospho-CoA kinase
VPAIGITGGVATGKSSFARAFLEHWTAEFFDADACVHELLAGDPELLQDIRMIFGDGVIASDGTFDRAAMREIAFNDASARGRLESLIHPRVRARWLPKAQAARGAGGRFVADIPLLFETGAEEECDLVVVVACSPGVQRSRMQLNRGLAPTLIDRIIESQLEQAAKISRADYVVWNDGSPAVLEEQARLLAATLRERYG